MLNEISVPFEDDGGEVYDMKARVLLRRLIRLKVRFGALSESPSSSSRDLFELELRSDVDDAEELLSRSVAMMEPKVSSNCRLDSSRKACSSLCERVGRALWILLKESLWYSVKERCLSAGPHRAMLMVDVESVTAGKVSGAFFRGRTDS